MSIENVLEILDALEQRVEELVGTVRVLKTERDQLRQKLEEAEQQRDGLNRDLASFQESRAEVRQRIQAMIDKIEQLEY